MPVRSVMLSGMSLVERVTADRFGFVAKDTIGATGLCVFLDGEAEGRNFFTANLGTHNGNRAMSRGDVEKMVEALLALGPIYATVDTYLALVFQTGLLRPDQIAGVFPWATETPCKVAPIVTPYTDAVCRNVALYYWQLHHHPMRDWEGRVRTFPYRASNTLSYRAKAPYHNIKVELREKIQPAAAGRLTLQFDWSAAEFNLILQHLGYQPPEDAYGDFVAAGLERDLTKKIILAYIYGAMTETLYHNANGDALAVNRILGKLNEFYPLVGQWREQCINCRLAEFNGFRYDLGDVEYKRPNHWAQTALQLCKWELLSRLTCAGVHTLGAGDLHDQLFFDVDPVNEREQVAEVIKQVRAPAFGRYNLRPQFKQPAVAWG
jgi:hypothetical protein